MPMTKYVADWLVRADEDIDIAELAIKEKGPTNPICFHTQQAAEKYLKAFLAFHEKHIRKIHDLEDLLITCKEIDASFGELRDDAQYLNQFYIETRYPADMPDFTFNDAKKSYEVALRVKKFVLAKLK